MPASHCSSLPYLISSPFLFRAFHLSQKKKKSLQPKWQQNLAVMSSATKWQQNLDVVSSARFSQLSGWSTCDQLLHFTDSAKLGWMNTEQDKRKMLAVKVQFLETIEKRDDSSDKLFSANDDCSAQKWSSTSHRLEGLKEMITHNNSVTRKRGIKHLLGY